VATADAVDWNDVDSTDALVSSTSMASIWLLSAARFPQRANDF